MSLNELVKYAWHDELWKSINSSIDSGRLHHALLLWGQQGLAKEEFSLLLAKRLLCLSDNKACNLCQGCHWFNSGTHPDFIKLVALKDKKNISVDQIRQLQTTLSLTRTQKTPRVVLIEAAERMNLSASNALLKSLEEPSDETIYILVTKQLSAMPATVQSRCQKLYFSPVNHRVMNQYLLDNGYRSEDASLLNGSPLLAQEYLSEAKLEERNVVLDELLALFSNQSSPCQVVAKWSKLDERFVLRVLYEWFSDLVKLSNGIESDYLINLYRLSSLKDMLIKMPLSQLFGIMDRLTTLTKHLSFSRQVNTALWLEDIAIGILGEPI